MKNNHQLNFKEGDYVSPYWTDWSNKDPIYYGGDVFEVKQEGGRLYFLAKNQKNEDQKFWLDEWELGLDPADKPEMAA